MSQPARDPEAPTVGQSVALELAFGIAGLTFIAFTSRSIARAYHSPEPVYEAIGIGLVIGLVLGAVFGFALTRPAVAWRVAPFLARFSSSEPTLLNFAALGLAAALGEESLFRAAIQPYFGIGLASLLFMAAHIGVADWRHPTPRKAAYAALVFGMGLLLGWLFDNYGIACSMATHFAFDTTALYLVRPLFPAPGTNTVTVR